MSTAARLLILCLAPALLLSGCLSTTSPLSDARIDSIASLLDDIDELPQNDDTLWARPTDSVPLKNMGYSIQAGAFSSLENAVRFEEVLNSRGIDAFYFKHESELYKVRFGNHGDYASARNEAERLQRDGLIESFFIVIPEAYVAAQIKRTGKGDLRQELVDTVRGFLGVPYRWGGTSAAGGFDCSGLTLVCYRLNGLALPRVSYMQASAGRWVPRKELKPGDLIFFATGKTRKVSHVGMYIGNDEFIHAPRKGQTLIRDLIFFEGSTGLAFGRL